MRKLSILFAVTLVPACLGGAVDDPPTSSESPALAALGSPPVVVPMPIEVMPLDAASLSSSFVASRTLTVSSDVARLVTNGWLYLRGHALAYRDGNTVNHAKAAVRLDSGPWIDLVNPTPTAPNGLAIVGLDANYGGIGGGFRTVRVKVPVTALCGSAGCVTAGNHTVSFRWNGTDGTSSGYRVVELNLRAATGEGNLLPDSSFAVDDPTNWQPPLPGAADIAEGNRLFHARRILLNRPGGVLMNAACADCHARDGGDLEYYSYSNTSIENRSMFHGLSLTQGAQIAAYVRTNPAERRGRPWNPPYQPGVGRDALGASWWAAGAGLDAVQPETRAQLDQLFPDGRTSTDSMAQNILGRATNPLQGRTTNMRELPIAIQLPDWNSWLPEVHPIDLWGPLVWDAGDGSFETALSMTTTLLAAPSALAAADLDGDTRVDLAVGQGQSNQVWVLPGAPHGARGPTQPVTMGSSPIAVALADLTGDGVPDLLSANYDSDDVSARAGDGHGAFGAVASRTSGDGPRALATGDWNNDGRLDVAVAQFLADRIAVHLGNGTTTLGAPITRAAGDGPIDLAAGELDGNTNLDLVAVSSLTNHVLVFSGRGDGSFGSPTSLAVGLAPQAVALGDLDGDRRLDIVVANQNDPSLSIIRRTATGGYRSPTTVPLPGQPADVALADVDADGDLDAVVTVRSGNDVVTAFNDGAGSFPARADTVLTDPGALAVADFDLDGALDVAVGASTAARVTIVPARRGFDPSIAPSVVQGYQEARAQLETLNFRDTTAVATLPFILGPLAQNGRAFIGGSGWLSNGDGTADGFRTTRGAVLDAAVIRGYSMELVKRSLAQWIAVKYWELMHRYSLETLGPTVFGADNGEVLSWPMGANRAVFDIAPHLLSQNRNQFRHPSAYPIDHDACRDVRYAAMPGCASAPLDAAQSELKGDYDSSAWYHLQILLHAGARSLHTSVDDTSAVVPVDWPYAMMHVDDIDRRASAIAATIPGAPSAWEPIRYLATMMKTYQMRDNGLGPALNGWAMRDVSPRLLVSNFRGESERVELLTELDTIEPGTRTAVSNAFLHAFHLVTQGPGAAAGFASWERFDPNTCIDRDTWFMIDPPEHAAMPPTSTIEFPSGGQFSHADDMWNALPMIRAIPNIAQWRVNYLRDWAAMEWPGPTATPNRWATR